MLKTYAQTNLQTADYRLNHKPIARICDVCLQAPAVRRVTHRDERDGTYVTANVCQYCSEKAGK